MPETPPALFPERPLLPAMPPLVVTQSFLLAACVLGAVIGVGSHGHVGNTDRSAVCFCLACHSLLRDRFFMVMNTPAALVFCVSSSLRVPLRMPPLVCHVCRRLSSLPCVRWCNGCFSQLVEMVTTPESYPVWRTPQPIIVPRHEPHKYIYSLFEGIHYI